MYSVDPYSEQLRQVIVNFQGCWVIYSEHEMQLTNLCHGVPLDSACLEHENCVDMLPSHIQYPEGLQTIEWIRFNIQEGETD